MEFLSLKGRCTGWSESIVFKMPHCWKSNVTAHLIFKLLPQSEYPNEKLCYQIRPEFLLVDFREFFSDLGPGGGGGGGTKKINKALKMTS